MPGGKRQIACRVSDRPELHIKEKARALPDRISGILVESTLSPLAGQRTFARRRYHHKWIKTHKMTHKASE